MCLGQLLTTNLQRKDMQTMAAHSQSAPLYHKKMKLVKSVDEATQMGKEQYGEQKTLKTDPAESKL